MDPEQLKSLLDSLGFDPALAAHAVMAVPIFRWAGMPAAKLLSFVPKQWEKATALAITAALELLVNNASGNHLAFPVVSAAAVGAIFSMIVYDIQYKKEKPEAVVQSGGN